MPDERVSNCCRGTSVEFYWAYCPAPTQDEHIEWAVELLWDAIAKPGERGWSPQAKAMARSEFRDRIRAATEGGLIPRDELKPLRQGEPPIFEIRWQAISVLELDENHAPREYHEVAVRLIHAEPDELGVCAVGLHAHEKVFFEGDKVATRRAQNREIDEAVNRYRNGVGEVWGLTRREVVGGSP